MIGDLHTFFIHGIWPTMDPELKLFRTVFVPTKDVTASISLSLVTFGALQTGDRRVMGWVGSVIKKGAFADDQNRAQNIPTSTSWDRNGVRINRCVFVTYQLSVAYGEAVAQCNLFFHEPLVQSMKKMSTRHAILHDKKTGEALSAHSVTVLPGARVPSDRLLTREIRKCAAADLNRSERTLGLHFHNEAGFRFAEGLRVDAKAGKLVTSAAVRSTCRV